MSEMERAADDALRDFRSVYRAHYGLVWHALFRLGMAPSAIEDAVQDVFVVAYRRRADYEGPSTKAWLYGIARRVASNYRRSSRRRTQRRRAIATAERHVSSADVPEVIHSLDRYLASLRSDDRELFILSELEGMTGPEIAQARGRNVQTIYTRIRKLRQDFRLDVEDRGQLRRARPRATARSWAALVPMLGGTKAAAAGGLALLGSGWFLGGLGVAAAAVVLAASVASPGRSRADGVAVAPGTSPEIQVPDSTASATPAAVDGLEPEPATTPLAAPDTDEAASASSGEHPPAPLTSPTPAERGDPPVAPAGSAGDPTPPALRSTGRAASRSPVVTTAAPPEPSVDEPTHAAPSDELSAENELLGRVAGRVRAGAGDDALALLDEHARRFPNSAFDDLRAALRIEALCQQGKVSQARGEARVFARQHPGSPAAARIEKSCIASPKNPGQADKPGT